MKSGFFNSDISGYDEEGMPIFDRAQESSFFAKYFSSFIGNGIFPNPSNNIQVLAQDSMKVLVQAGSCYINGYMGYVEEAEMLELEKADSLDRIDRIVARLDIVDRNINLFVKKGIASANPISPELERNTNMYEIALADIKINKNVGAITQANITDLRLNAKVCGVVTSTVQSVDTQTLFNQYETWYREITNKAEVDIAEVIQKFKDDFNSWYSDFTQTKEEKIDTWFETIKNKLGEEPAISLQNQIDGIYAQYIESKDEILEQIYNLQEKDNDFEQRITTLGNNKVDKISGKSLSANDYTSAEKTQLNSLWNGNSLPNTLLKAIFLAQNPVGTILLTTTSTNPGTRYDGSSGTWALWGAGRVPVGINTADDDFKTVEKAGGAKTHTLIIDEIPSHAHGLNNHTHSFTATAHRHLGLSWLGDDTNQSISLNPGTAEGYNLSYTGKFAKGEQNFIQTKEAKAGGTIGAASGNTANAGSGKAHNNLQPYITCYMWKRTA